MSEPSSPPTAAASGPVPGPGRWLGALAASAAGLIVASVVAPLAPIDPFEDRIAALIAYAFGFASVSACVLACAMRAPSSPRVALAAVTGGVGVLVLASLVPPSALVAAGVLVALLALGTAVGSAIGRRIQHPGHLGIVALVSSCADIASVTTPGAPSHAVADSPTLLSLFAMSWPMLGTSRIEPLLGVGDVVFVALYAGAAARHALSMPRTWVALASGLAVTACVVALLELPVPALPFLGAAMLVAHPSARLPPPAERKQAAVALVVLFVVLGALVLARRSG